MDRLANILDGYIEKKRQKLTALSEEIWRYAEVGFQEFRSAQALERCLEDEHSSANVIRREGVLLYG